MAARVVKLHLVLQRDFFLTAETQRTQRYHTPGAVTRHAGCNRVCGLA